MPSRPAADARYPAEARLKSKAHFDRVFREGRKVVLPGIVAWLAPAPASARRCRLGLSVNRKVGDAVRRNRVKRVLREAFRSAELPDAPLDVVLIARPGRAPDTLAAARTALASVLDRWARGRTGAGEGRRPC
jgi:ribonuclease P protein component